MKIDRLIWFVALVGIGVRTQISLILETIVFLPPVFFDKDKLVSIKKQDLSIAKNYLNEEEIKLLGLLVEQYLAFVETMAQQHQPMTMKDWIDRLDAILQLNGRDLLTHAGQISHKMTAIGVKM